IAARNADRLELEQLERGLLRQQDVAERDAGRVHAPDAAASAAAVELLDVLQGAVPDAVAAAARAPDHLAIVGGDELPALRLGEIAQQQGHRTLVGQELLIVLGQVLDGGAIEPLQVPELGQAAAAPGEALEAALVGNTVGAGQDPARDVVAE